MRNWYRRVAWIRLAAAVALWSPSAATAHETPPATPPSDLTGHIVYSTADGIWTMGADGSDRRQATHPTEMHADYDPALSPDGRTIVFRSSRATPPDSLMLVDVDGANERSLAVLAGLPEGFGMAQAGWSPDGTKLVFTCTCPQNTGRFSGIYTANLDGSELTKLNDDGQYPDWSPDGSKIVYMADRDGNHELYVMNADGSEETNLTHNPASDNVPRWSPDGTRIVFFTDRDGNEEIYTINADGTGLTRITNTETRYEEFPIWTPDHRIVFNRGVPFDTETPPTWHLVNADGSGEVQFSPLTEVAAGFADWIADPSDDRATPVPVNGPATAVASPIGGFSERALGGSPAATASVGGGSGRLAFVSTRDGVHGIYVLDIAEALQAGGTDAATRLTDHSGPSVDPAWSPDGRKITYRHLDPGAASSDLWLMDADGGNAHLLMRGGGSPAWSPDGTQIAFAALGENGALGIALLDVAATLADPEGTAPVFLTRESNPAPEEYPVWSPDGSQLCFASYRDGNWEIYVMNADGSEQRNLTNSPALEYGCTWSADGSRVAFDSDRGGTSGIYAVDTDGSGLTELTGPGGGAGPVWSPDGTTIAFTSLRDGQPFAAEIYLMNADGTDPVRLTRSLDNDAFPAWQPALPSP